MEDQHVSPTAPEDYRKEENRDSRADESEEENDDSREEPVEENKDTKKEHEEEEEEKVEDKLLKKEKESIHLDIQTEGDDTATLPLRKKKDDEAKEDEVKDKSKNKPSLYLFPITRLKIAWSSSSSVCEFFFKAILIIFSTLGWLFCIGGFPFVSIAQLIIGSIYIGDCIIQPNIPKYLIVSGVFGTIQHLIAIWTKYIPRDSKGNLKLYRSYCRAVDCVIQLFLTIWFVLGCIWVYRVYNDVDYEDTQRNEYCHKTLYLFAFWILNFSFIILALLSVVALACIVCVLSSPKDKNKETESIA